MSAMQSSAEAVSTEFAGTDRAGTEFERVVPAEIQRIFDMRCEGVFATQEAFREAVRRAKAARTTLHAA